MTKNIIILIKEFKLFNNYYKMIYNSKNSCLKNKIF